MHAFERNAARKLSRKTPELREQSSLFSSLFSSLACDYARGAEGRLGAHRDERNNSRERGKKRRDAAGWEVKGRGTETKTRKEEKG